MPCKIQIKENVTRVVEDKTNNVLDKSLSVAQNRANQVNSEFNYNVVNFIQQEDSIERVINIPESLVDDYYFHELDLEKKEIEDLSSIKDINKKEKILSFFSALNFKVDMNADQLLQSVKTDKTSDTEVVTGAIDVMQKFVAIAKGSENEKLPELAAYVIYEMLGRKNKLNKDLWFNIDKWSKYEEVYNKYAFDNLDSDISDFIDILPDEIDKVKDASYNPFARKMAIVSLLKEMIETYNDASVPLEKRKSEDVSKEYFEKRGYKNPYEQDFLVRIWNNFINWINDNILNNSRFEKYDENKLKDLTLDIVDDIFKEDYVKFTRGVIKQEQTLIDSQGNVLELKTYDESINSDPKAKSIIDNVLKNIFLTSDSEVGPKLSGSATTRKYGTTYRKADESFHDLDFVIPLSVVQREDGYGEIISTINRNLGNLSPEFVQKELIPLIKKQSWYKNFTQLYPNFKLLTSFVGKDHTKGESITITGVIDGEFKNGKYVPDTGYIIDFFYRTKEGNYPEEFDSYWKSWKGIFEAKLSMGRSKDLVDFIYFDPFVEDKFKFNKKGYRYFSFSSLEENPLNFTTPQQQQQTFIQTKPGVQELFESNPELANAVYSALGFKSFDTKGVSLDTKERDGWKWIKLNGKNIGEVKLVKNDRRSKEVGLSIKLNEEHQNKGYGQIVHILVADWAKNEFGDTLYSDFDNSQAEINTLLALTKKGYSEQIGDYGIQEDGRYNTDVRAFRIKTSDEIGSITPEQKQQALQLYSQYLEQIFPDSKVKDIVYHGSYQQEKLDNFLNKEKAYHKNAYYFLDKKTDYGNKFINALVNLKNPSQGSTASSNFNVGEGKKQHIQKGFDGVIADQEDKFYINTSLEHLLQPYKKTQGTTQREIIVFEPEQIHILGSKQDIEGFKEFVSDSDKESIQQMFQTDNMPASRASKETIAKIKELLTKMGVPIQSLQEYLKGNPNINVTGVNGLADLVRKVVAVAEGKEDVSLTEEMVHVATAIIEKINPKLITEMISKIDRFVIYKQVLKEYSNNPYYQLPDGKPDIRKIKKEAVDKLIAELIIKQSEGSTQFPELSQEIERSFVAKLFQKIIDFFKLQYRKANVDVFQKTANIILEGKIDSNINQLEGGLFFQQSNSFTEKQLELQRRILETRSLIEKREDKNEKVDPILLDTEEASNYYEIKQSDGSFKKLTKRVTDRVKNWYKQRFGDKKFTEAQKKFNKLKRETGVKFHYFFEEIHSRYFDNTNGTRRTSPGKRQIKLDDSDYDVYERLENYFVDLINEFSKDGKNPMVFSEVIVYDPKEQEAGTIDLLIVDEDGKAHIFDWKFMSISEQSNDVPWFKQGAFGIQLSRYKNILKDAYGVKEIGMNRAIPILMEFKRMNPFDVNSDLKLKGINVGSVDVSQIEDLRLVPVSEETESTGDKQLDKLIKQLNSIYRQITSNVATSDEEREFKRERLNILKLAIRAAQSSRDIAPLIDVINIMRKEGQQIINDWETIYQKRNSSDKDLEDVELSDFSENIREYLAISEVFGRIDDLIGPLIYTSDMEKDAVTKEQKEEVIYRKSILEKIREEKTKIANSRDDVKEIAGLFADKFIGERNLVKGLTKPQALWKGLSSFFRGASESPLTSIQVLFKMITNARSKASYDANKLVDRIMEIRKRIIDRGGNTREFIKKIYQSDDKGKFVNKLIRKYKKEFYSDLDDNALEGKQDKNWIYENVNIEEYKKEALKMLNSRIKKIMNLYSENHELRDKLILEEERKWDISRRDFNGWNNYILKRHPKDKWFSDEYKEILKDKDLLDLYNFISEVNDQAVEIGYLQNKVHSTFLPFVTKSMAESIAWNFDLSAIMRIGDDLKLRAQDVGYGSINELTNEIERSIPKYYTQDFTKKEDGTRDYSDVSEDLFKNMILYVNHLQKYKYLSEVEGQLKLVKTIEQFKYHLDTTTTGDIVMENGKPREMPGDNNNFVIFDNFLRALLYEERYPISDSDTALNFSVRNIIKKAINTVARKEVYPLDSEPDAKSLVKTMDTINRAFQLKTLGFEIISGAVNLFGSNIQAANQSGVYFKANEFLKNETLLIGNKYKNNEEREMFVQLIETFMPMKDDPTYDKLKEAGLSKLTRINFSDQIMMFMRNPELHIERTMFKTLLDNMMVENGKIVSIREFVKNKYSNRTASSQSYRQSKEKIEKEIEELKKTRSITNTKKLEDGKLVIPGLDLSNRSEIQRLTNLTRRLSRSATANVADADINRMQMSIWTKSMMVFKNWIPKLVDTRFGEFRKISDDFSVEIDENGMTTGEKYEIGRLRLFLPFLSFNVLKTVSEINSVLSVSEQGLSKIDSLYKKYAEEYKKKTGEDLEMSLDDFTDLVVTNLSNQIKELVILLLLFAAKLSLGLIAPDDEDDDRADKNAHRFAERVVDKFVGELSFFYDPTEARKLLSGSAFPAIGLFSDVSKFFSHITMEFTGIDISNLDVDPETVRKKAQPIKYGAKMLPLTKSLITYGAILDADFAKEFDITIQKETNR